MSELMFQVLPINERLYQLVVFTTESVLVFKSRYFENWDQADCEAKRWLFGQR